MNIFDVVVNTDDIVVLGPPSIIDVSLDIGEQGVRGSTFYAGSGDPNLLDLTSHELIAGDMFINTSVASGYGWLYTYNPKQIGDQWDAVLRLQPPMYASIVAGVFTSGSATFSIPLSSIVPADITVVDENNIIISATPKGANPVAFSVVSKTINGSNFEFVIKAVSFNGTTWSDLSGSNNFAIHLTVV